LFDFMEFWESLSDQQKADFEARLLGSEGRAGEPTSEIAEKDARDPFRTFCPRCRRDSDVWGNVFSIRDPIRAPHSEFRLLGVRCDSCQLEFDLAIWLPGSTTPAGTLAEDETPDTMRPLDRYCHMVRVALQRWGRVYERHRQGEQGHLGIFFPRAYVDPSETRATAIPAWCLAAARALRKAVALHPGEGPFGRLQIGPFLCALGLDTGHPEVVPYLLHLYAVDSSMPRTPAAQEKLYFSPVVFALACPTARTPKPIEVRFLASLFFLPSEISRLYPQEDPDDPGAHVYLPLRSPLLPEC
jgi:hypothetical protein